ncbi:Calreticulin like [Actinidia chinensis var. chinensis]|uniref:Calreticulin like n=1 Tax=Actinidia chinensis var. chinensis TaxID=1590841 RepID=A0A2R6RP25_ACTCC|nr:Calreticulin like [Actinidia chinensis var. chinensis]
MAGEWNHTSGKWNGDPNDKEAETEMGMSTEAVAEKITEEGSTDEEPNIGRIRRKPSWLKEYQLSGDSTARIWKIADATSRSSLQNGHSRVIVLKHVKGQTNEKNKDVTTLDWNVSVSTIRVAIWKLEVLQCRSFAVYHWPHAPVEWGALPLNGHIKFKAGSIRNGVFKLEDWDDKEYIPDPEDKKPEGYDDIPKEISDPDAKKPEDWDDEEDGEWTLPTTANHACLQKRKCVNYNFTKKSF